MTWRAVAAKDVRTAARSKTVWLVFAVVVCSVLGYAGVHAYGGEDSFQAYLGGLAGLLGVFLPLLGILLGYKSVIHERTSGAIALSLSLPHSRRDLVVGTVVGRAVVLLAPTLVALAVAGVAGVALYGTDGALRYPWFLFVTALYGIAFLGVAVGLSMATTSERRLSFAAVGGYLLLVSFWDDLHALGLIVLHRFDFAVLESMPDWALLARLLKPGEAYGRLLRAGFDVDLAGRYVVESAPAYVDWPVALAVLLAWTVVPLALGFRRFRDADL